MTPVTGALIRGGVFSSDCALAAPAARPSEISNAIGLANRATQTGKPYSPKWGTRSV